MPRWTIVQVLAVVLSLAAAYVSAQLLAKHTTGSSGAAWFDAGCNPDAEGGGANCAAVLASPYSYWPPKHDDAPKGTGYLPVAFLGLVYFSTLTVWLGGVGRPSRSRRWLHLMLMLGMGVGLLSSVRFLYIMFTMIDEWCPWCLLTHILNFLIFLCVVLMWPRAKKVVIHEARSSASPDVAQSASGETAELARAASSAADAEVVHPSTRLLFVTVGAMALVVFGQGQMLGRINFGKQALTAKQGFDQCLAAVNRIKGDANKLVTNWKLAEKRTFTLRADDPVRTGAEPGESAVQLVLFSDFQCPSCKRLAEFIDEQAQPLFAGRLNIAFKHYPLCTDCNGRVKNTLHKHACFAAAAAEAARIMGGNDAFWQAHDYLFEHQEQLKQGQLTPEMLAAQLGLDAKAFRETMRSEPVAKRIQEDINLAQSAEVTSTPTLFVSGRQVDTLARLVPEFWDRLAKTYWKSTGKPRPESTRLGKITATPHSQGQKAAP